MICPGCSAEMTSIELEARLGTTLSIDLCAACKAIWFDHFEALQMAPAATLRVFAIISEPSNAASVALPAVLRCPRCRSRLLHTHDIQRNTPFRYWRCDAGHGRLMTFMDFLRQKDFVRPLSPQQLEELRQNVRTINCSNCGAGIDLAKDSVCRHCGSAMSMLDLQQMTRTIAQLQAAAAGQRPAPPTATEPSVRLASADLDSLILAIRARGGAGGDNAGPSLIAAGLGMLGDLLRKRFL
jgi:DNA-directed RNA polymerase subunit RPC12/RpoP